MNTKISIIFAVGFLCNIQPTFALDQCNYESPNNVFTPTAEVLKEDVCGFSEIVNYKYLFYFSGSKAICADKKDLYCAKATREINDKTALRMVDLTMPIDKLYWVQAAKLCGIDYQAKLESDCAKYAQEGGWNGSYAFELYCKPEQVQAFAARQCGGRAYTTGSSSSDRAFCGRNYKGTQDPRFIKDAKTNEKPKFNDGKSLTKACQPEMTLQHAKYLKENASSSGSSNASKPASSSSSSSGSGSSGSSSSGNSASAPSAPKAPDTVDDALNKAKKLKDVFGF